MVQRIHIQWCAILLLMITVSLSACAAPTPVADLTLNTGGCMPSSITLPPTHEPMLTIHNTAHEAMVVSIPVMDLWIEVAPRDSGVLELPRYIMGTFDLFCLSAADHRALGGDNPFLCVLEPDELRPVSRSSGKLIIEPHDRIREVLEQGR
ncbi:cupredoxin domain-containing protein [Chloroflexus sp.]